MLLTERRTPSWASSVRSFSRPHRGYSSRIAWKRWTTGSGVCGWRTPLRHWLCDCNPATNTYAYLGRCAASRGINLRSR